MAAAVATTGRRAAGRVVRGPHCPRCGQQLAEHGTTCTACRKPFAAVVFAPPARLSRQADSASAESTACANHETNLAVDACSRCGAFICALCRMETDELVACPACLELLEQEGKLASLRKDVINYGYLAAYSGLGALLIFPLAPLLVIPSLLYVRRNIRQNRALNERIGVWQQRWAVGMSVLGLLLGVGFWLFILLKAGR